MARPQRHNDTGFLTDNGCSPILTFFGIDRQDDIIWMVWAQSLPCCQWKPNSTFETLVHTVHHAIIDK